MYEHLLRSIVKFLLFIYLLIFVYPIDGEKSGRNVRKNNL